MNPLIRIFRNAAVIVLQVWAFFADDNMARGLLSIALLCFWVSLWFEPSESGHTNASGCSCDDSPEAKE